MDRNLVGLRFQSLRIRKGFKRQVDMINDFKEKTGIELKKSAVSMYEKGERFPEPDLLITFAEYFGVTTDFLHGRSDIELSIVKSTVSNLEILLDKLSENDQKQALEYLEYLNFKKKV